MTIENWQRVKELLDQAIEMAPEQRAKFLDEACGSDGALRAELESLLSVGRWYECRVPAIAAVR